jgi:hypothetical protein
VIVSDELSVTLGEVDSEEEVVCVVDPVCVTDTEAELDTDVV